MTGTTWSNLMELGIRLRDDGLDLQSISPLFEAANHDDATDEQVARANSALCVSYRKLGMLGDAEVHAKLADAAAKRSGDVLLQAACLRDHAEVRHEMAMNARGKWRRQMLDKAADMLWESRQLIRSIKPLDQAELAATESFLSLVKYHLMGNGRANGAASVATFAMLDERGTPQHVYHVNALIRYIRILPWSQRGRWARKALTLLPAAGLESRRRDVLVARHLGDRGYRIAKQVAQRLRR